MVSKLPIIWKQTVIVIVDDDVLLTTEPSVNRSRIDGAMVAYVNSNSTRNLVRKTSAS